MASLFYKDPDEVLDYEEDWSDWLDSDTIDTSDWVVPSGITEDSDSNTTTTATIWLSGGTAGEAYNLVNRITTDAGRTADRSIVIFVREQLGQFTYRGDLTTNRDKVRFYVQDTAEDSGPKPGGGNFTDDEIDGLVTLEGSWAKAVAGAFEVLASAWAKHADITAGPNREALSQVAESYRKQAAEWRERHGSTATSGYRFVTRVDGYSDDVAADET